MGGRVMLAVGLVVMAGCGTAERRDGDADAHRAEVARNPYALTCLDLARQPENSTNQRLVIHVEFALAEDPLLRERVRDMTSNRVGRSVYWALTEICKHRDGSYRPGREAVAAVRNGRYLVQPRPESWSHPELWSDPVVKELSRSRRDEP